MIVLEITIIVLQVINIILLIRATKSNNQNLQPLVDKLKASGDALDVAVNTNTPVGLK